LERRLASTGSSIDAIHAAVAPQNGRRLVELVGSRRIERMERLDHGLGYYGCAACNTEHAPIGAA
jgi:hypothetical protein